MLFTLTPLAGISSTVLLFVRLLAGALMLYYGWPKIKDLRANAEEFNEMGFRPGWLHGSLVAFTEFFGGLAVITGVFTWLAAAGFAFEMMLGTVWKITRTDKPFTDWSYDLLLLALMAVLLAIGTGQYTLINLFL